MKILTLIPIKPQLHPLLRMKAYVLAAELPAANPDLEITTVFDHQTESRQHSDRTPWRKVARVRNRLLDIIDYSEFDYILWIDADVNQYDADMPSRLIAANPGGITSPMVFVENDPSWLYYTAATCLRREPPHWPEVPKDELVEIDCTGTIYTCKADIYAGALRHTDHPNRTDHWSICERARKMGRKVIIHRGVVVWHANLPNYGEMWH